MNDWLYFYHKILLFSNLADANQSSFYFFLPFHFVHVRCVLPVLAGILTGDFGAYKYLGTSIAGFPDATGLDAELKAAGFAKVSHKRMLFGTVALHQAQA